MLATELLLATLEDLVEDDFKKLKWYLSLKISENWKPIPKSYVEKASRTDTVSIMIERHEEEPAVRLTAEILRKMNNNEAAGNLESLYSEGKTSTPSTSTSSSDAVAPGTAPKSISATNGSTVIIPTLHGCKTGTLNINIR